MDADEYVLELFRGPTASFKDLSSRLLPYFLQHAASTADGSARYWEIKVPQVLSVDTSV